MLTWPRLAEQKVKVAHRFDLCIDIVQYLINIYLIVT